MLLLVLHSRVVLPFISGATFCCASRLDSLPGSRFGERCGKLYSMRPSWRLAQDRRKTGL